jgi:hypothetical protein
MHRVGIMVTNGSQKTFPNHAIIGITRGINSKIMKKAAGNVPSPISINSGDVKTLNRTVQIAVTTTTLQDQSQ